MEGNQRLSHEAINLSSDKQHGWSQTPQSFWKDLLVTQACLLSLRIDCATLWTLLEYNYTRYHLNLAGSRPTDRANLISRGSFYEKKLEKRYSTSYIVLTVPKSIGQLDLLLLTRLEHCEKKDLSLGGGIFVGSGDHRSCNASTEIHLII